MRQAKTTQQSKGPNSDDRVESTQVSNRQWSELFFPTGERSASLRGRLAGSKIVPVGEGLYVGVTNWQNS